jgi:hypothetical protein
MKEYKIILITLLLTLIISIISFVAFIGNDKQNLGVPMPWQSYVQNNQVNVLNITLGTSQVKNLMQILGTEAEVSLFKDKKLGTRHLEVFFDSAKIGGLNTRIIASLEFNEEVLLFLDENVKDHEVMPSGNEKVEFNTFASNKLIDLIITDLTIAPKTNLSEDVIIMRFGEPIIKQDNYWLYPKKGLKILMDEGLKILEYSNSYIQ